LGALCLANKAANPSQILFSIDISIPKLGSVKQLQRLIMSVFGIAVAVVVVV